MSARDLYAAAPRKRANARTHFKRIVVSAYCTKNEVVQHLPLVAHIPIALQFLALERPSPAPRDIFALEILPAKLHVRRERTTTSLAWGPLPRATTLRARKIPTRVRSSPVSRRTTLATALTVVVRPHPAGPAGTGQTAPSRAINAWPGFSAQNVLPRVSDAPPACLQANLRHQIASRVPAIGLSRVRGAVSAPTAKMDRRPLQTSPLARSARPASLRT